MPTARSEGPSDSKLKRVLPHPEAPAPRWIRWVPRGECLGGWGGGELRRAKSSTAWTPQEGGGPPPGDSHGGGGAASWGGSRLWSSWLGRPRLLPHPSSELVTRSLFRLNQSAKCIQGTV